MLGPWLDATGYRTALVGKYLNHYDDPTYVPPGWDFWRARDFGYYNYTVSEDGVPRTYGSAPLLDDIGRTSTCLPCSLPGSVLGDES